MNFLLQRIYYYFLLMRFHRPVGILLLLWPTLWALWIAGHGQPYAHLVIIFCAGVVLMRSAGCIVNDIADQNFDGHVKRTHQRPLVQGTVSVVEAWVLFIFICLIAFLLVLQLNFLTILLAIPALAIAIIYPFCKRWTHLPQLILGFAFSWGIPMSFAAQTNTVPAIAWLLFLAAIVWPIIYDTFYAMSDRSEDLKIGIKSTAILFGSYDRLVTALLQITMLMLLTLLGWILKLNICFFISLIVVALFFTYQQYLIKTRDATQSFAAFINNHWVGLVIFVGILLGLLPN